eukprot:TRINITY_DN27378_c0_g3_i1.p1 TRINITY_DN27378_c0_g3~~TRINITY_DN27378_c0_g3_i1.p1  ORF type:complete len:553 (+),score=94.02 TRINITY_DN27378_c0_g3_i1:57-1715(+)
MERYTLFDSCLAVYTGVIVLASLQMLLYSAFFRNTMGGVYESFRRILDPVDEKLDPSMQRTVEQFQSDQKNRIKTCCEMCTIVLVYLTIDNVLQLLIESLTHRNDAQRVLICVGATIGLAAIRFSFLSPSRAPQIAYLTVMLFGETMLQMSFDSVDEVTMAAVRLGLLRLALTQTYMDMKTVVFSNVIVVIGDCLKYSRAIQMDSCQPSEPCSFAAFVWADVAATLFLIAYAFCARRAAFKVMILVATADHSNAKLSALKVLLEHTCKVVLPLDADLAIRGEEERFAAALMLEPTQIFTGMKLLDFMPFQEDKDRFEILFEESSPACSSSVLRLHVHLQDGSGSNPQYELFGVPLAGLHEEQPEHGRQDTRFLLGIRRVGDAEFAAPEQYPNAPKVKTSRSRSSGARVLGKRVAQTYHGTGPSSEEGSIREHKPSGAEIDDSASDVSDSSRGGHDITLALPHLRATTRVAKVRTLIELIASWNTKAVRKPCCTFHAALPEVKKVLDMLAVAPCRPTTHADVVSQCRECALLNTLDEDFDCTSCGAKNVKVAL